MLAALLQRSSLRLESDDQTCDSGRCPVFKQHSANRRRWLLLSSSKSRIYSNFLLLIPFLFLVRAFMRLCTEANVASFNLVHPNRKQASGLGQPIHCLVELRSLKSNCVPRNDAGRAKAGNANPVNCRVHALPTRLPYLDYKLSPAQRLHWIRVMMHVHATWPRSVQRPDAKCSLVGNNATLVTWLVVWRVAPERVHQIRNMERRNEILYDWCWF